MESNRDIIEKGYWSSSSSGSNRSQFDEDYYRMKPPPPNPEDYKDKILVIKKGQFSQLEAQLQNVILSNTSNIQSNVHQNPNSNAVAASSSKSSNNINSSKVFTNTITRQNFERENSDASQMPNSNAAAAPSSNSSNNINNPKVFKNTTTRQNFERGNSNAPHSNNAGISSESTGAFSKINVNDRQPRRYQTPRNSITKSNATSQDRVQDIQNGETKQLLAFQDNIPRSLRMKAPDVHLPIHSTSVDRTSSITGRCNEPNTKITTQKSNLRSSSNSKTYRTFSAAPQIVSTNAVQIHQPTSVRRSETVTTENTSDNCNDICCCWFKCCL